MGYDDDPSEDEEHASPTPRECGEEYAFFVCKHCPAWTTCKYAWDVLGLEE